MAIARYGWADGGGTNGTSHTFAFDVGSGSDRYVLAFAKIYGDITGLAATYNAVAMTTLATKAITDEAGSYAAAFGLAAPASGSNNLVVTRTPTSSHIVVSAIAYTGVSSTIEATGTQDTQSGAGVVNVTLTITNSNCWLVGGFAGKFIGGSFQDTAAGGDGTFIDDNGYVGAPGGLLGIYDSNGTVGTGSQTLGAYRGAPGGDTFSGIAIGLAPAGGGGGGSVFPLHYYAQMRRQ